MTYKVFRDNTMVKLKETGKKEQIVQIDIFGNDDKYTEFVRVRTFSPSGRRTDSHKWVQKKDLTIMSSHEALMGRLTKEIDYVYIPGSKYITIGCTPFPVAKCRDLVMAMSRICLLFFCTYQ